MLMIAANGPVYTVASRGNASAAGKRCRHPQLYRALHLREGTGPARRAETERANGLESVRREIPGHGRGRADDGAVRQE